MADAFFSSSGRIRNGGIDRLITSLILGSHNLTPKSLEHNRELSLQLDAATAPDVLAAVTATFDHDYQQAAPAPTSTR